MSVVVHQYNGNLGVAHSMRCRLHWRGELVEAVSHNASLELNKAGLTWDCRLAKSDCSPEKLVRQAKSVNQQS